MHEEKIVGVVEKIVYKNEDNSYHVLIVLLKDVGKECTVTGNHLKIVEGLSYEFYGEWASNSKYGRQFKSEKIFEIAPSSKEAMVKYLSSSFFKGIGLCLAS